MVCRCCNNEVTPVSNGLNNTGIIILVLTVLFCIPLVWLPFVMDSCKKKVCPSCGQEIL
ncbi:MAG: LITAF-like zinc ribbon domain-containing protein [Lentisphaeria bacterium]|nr:LITAF-like zinc ribbon domain-containing protein [Lentisphaeria bacterium]